jgi:release factor glutamine methyltransferase
LPSEFSGSFDVVVSNPPYIDTTDPEVADAVRKWEPDSALFAHDSGLSDLFAIAQQARSWLRPGGWLLLEFGHTQGPAVSGELKRLGYINIEVKQDLARLNRFAIAQREATG